MEIINTFLDSGINEGYYSVILRILEGETIAVGFNEVKRKIKEIGVKYIDSTYFEELIFGGNDGELYELGLI